MRILSFILFLSTMCLQAHADDFHLGGSVIGGRILDHANKVTPIIEQNTLGAELFVFRSTTGKQNWNAFFNYPEYGISYTFLNVGSPDYVGNAYCLFPYANFHFLNNRNKFNLNMRVGAGLAYVDKIYDPETNPLNLAVGTHLNTVVSLQLQGSYQINDRLTLSVGPNLTHISNGAYQMPNAGFNILNFAVGLNYSFGKKEKRIPGIEKKTDKSWDYLLFFGGGVKEIEPITGNKYFAGGITFEVSRQHLAYTRFGASIDITYDESDYYALIYQSKKPGNHIETMKAGLAGGYSVLFGNLSANVFLGAYLYAENTPFGRLYQRVGLRYSFFEKYCMQLALKTHKGRADYIEFGLGYKF